jgi:hypothetical protein
LVECVETNPAMIGDVQFLKRKLRALAQDKVDRLKCEEKKFRELLVEIKEKNEERKR